MTIKEIYERAVELKVENTPVLVSVSCSDDYYSFEAEPLQEEEIEITDKGVAICIGN